MGASLLVTARETLEASLVIGILLAYLAQTKNRHYFPSVWLGVGLAVAASGLLGTALFLTIGGLAGRPEEVFEGVVMWAAAGVLTYVLWWMGKQGRNMAKSLQGEARAALGKGSTLAITTLAFLAVFREGAETVLYLSAIASSSGGPGVITGAATGFGIAALAGYVVYKGGSRYLDLRVFFRVTTIILLVFAAGLVGKATLAFQAAGIFPGTIAVWDTSHLLSETVGVGAVLGVLVGYTATPSLLQVIFWLGYVALVVALYVDLGGRPREGRYEEPFSPIGSGYQHILYRVLRWPRLTTLVPALMGLTLVLLLAVALFGIDVGPFNNQGMLRWGPFLGEENENNLFNFVMWIAWLPLLSLGTVLLGRLWCGNLCPLRLVTDWARVPVERLTRKGSPIQPYMRIGWLLPVAFILITFFVKWWPVQTVARYGAIMFLVILALAVAVGFLFRRGTWCRYICPVGGWLARITRLSPLALRADLAVCASCHDKPCLRGTALAGRCPAYLNPSRLESNRYCLKCWACATNCPPERASLKLGWRFPGAELLKPYAPDLWESLFVASLLGMYMATGHRSVALAGLPWPLLFFGMIALTTIAYVAICAVSAPLAGISFRKALTVFGYIFLPVEFSAAVIAFGDDALEFFGIVQPAAAVLLAIGFIWSVILGVSILRNQSRGPLRAIASGVPLGLTLVTILFIWLQWYASGTVIDLT
ncbi:MAG: FTR1 family protein [Chloroflexi bacterium]|nr:FTR1 family protein [Chloroflexota bacterium]